MKILKFTKSKRGMYIITLEDNTKLNIHEDLILKNDLLLTKEIDNIDKLVLENKKYEIYEIALAYIDKKLRSSKELKNYLIKKEYDNNDIEEVIKLLYSQGYLNDEIYTNSYIHDRIVLSTDGPNKIIKYLEDNDISNDLILKGIETYTSDIEKERIEKLVSKQIKSNKNKGSYLLKRKIQMNLLNLGYNIELINEVLNNESFNDKELYEKEYNKIYNSLSKKYSGKELEYKIKQKLYQKGFSVE